MKTNGKYDGITTAIVTPLMPDGCGVDAPALADLVERQLKAGINGLLVLGGTGEYSALTFEQRVVAVKTTVDAAKGRVPVMAGVLEPGIGECIKQSRAFIAAGADSLLVLTPFYVHPTQEGIYQFYKKMDEALHFPFLVYNIPYRTSVNALPETIERLTDDLPNMIGMKECSPSFGQAQTVIRIAGDKCDVLSGEEFLMAAEVSIGACGGIMASANLLPELFLEVYALAKAGKDREAYQLLGKYTPLINLLFKETNPGPLKYAMNLAGIKVGGVSLPLLDPADDLKAAIAAEMKKLRIIA